MEAPKTTIPTAYRVIHALFRFVLAVFFGHILVENLDRLPSDGEPVLLLANHSNSLTDAVLLMASVPLWKRRMLRMTAKATLFRRGTFSGWLVEKAGSVPIMRAKDYENAASSTPAKVDNKAVLNVLNNALLDDGDCVSMFPEGLSRYHPALAPLKTGAARICSEVLSKAVARHQFDFRLQVITCSITYLHGHHFRSDVLVKFHDPIVLTPQTHPQLAKGDRQATLTLTSQITRQIRSGTLDSPSWRIVRIAHTARRLYAPMGTSCSLGDYVRLTQRFVDAFAGKRAERKWQCNLDSEPGLKSPVMLDKTDGGEESRSRAVDTSGEEDEFSVEEVDRLAEDLTSYQNDLVQNGIKDDRVRNNRLLHRTIIVKRLLFRIVGIVILTSISIPGLLLWTPIFVVARREAEKQKRKGPEWDTYDEITQTKLLYGLVTGVIVYLVAVVATFPFVSITSWGIPLLMWLTLRWCEDLVASLRAALALSRMLWLGKSKLKEFRNRRDQLQQRVNKLSNQVCGLPFDSKLLQLDSKNNNNKLGRLSYFSIRRRRKKDYNEVMKLWDSTDYPPDDILESVTS